MGEDTAESVDGALDFLVNASRVSPVLRAQVAIVEDEIRRLRREVARLTATAEPTEGQE